MCSRAGGAIYCRPRRTVRSSLVVPANAQVRQPFVAVLQQPNGPDSLSFHSSGCGVPRYPSQSRTPATARLCGVSVWAYQTTQVRQEKLSRLDIPDTKGHYCSVLRTRSMQVGCPRTRPPFADALRCPAAGGTQGIPSTGQPVVCKNRQTESSPEVMGGGGHDDLY